MFASVALAGLLYAIDRPYDYRIPENLQDTVLPGVRVFVPFGNGNRVTEGIVLSVSDESSYPNCKVILRTVDAQPLLGHEQLATTMRYVDVNGPQEVEALATLSVKKDPKVDRKWKRDDGTLRGFCGLG